MRHGYREYYSLLALWLRLPEWMMPDKKLEIIWKNEVVGFVEDLTADNFDWYGKWLPLDSAATRDFLTAVKSGQELWVQIGTEEPPAMGTVDYKSFHEQTINIKYRPQSKQIP